MVLQIVAVLLVVLVLGVVAAWQVRGDIDRRMRDGEDAETLDWRRRWFRRP